MPREVYDVKQVWLLKCEFACLTALSSGSRRQGVSSSEKNRTFAVMVTVALCCCSSCFLNAVVMGACRASVEGLTLQVKPFE